MDNISSDAIRPGFLAALRFWLKLGFISFGGPGAQISLMHEELVERRRWIGEAQFLHALNYCMLLPGPEAQQLAIYCGWLMHRAWGGIVAGVLFVLPSAVLLFALSWLYVEGQENAWVKGVFYGLKPAVLAIVLTAVLRIGKKALRTQALWGIGIAAFLVLMFTPVPFPFVMVGAALAGWWTGKRGNETSVAQELSGAPGNGIRPTWQRSLGVLVLCGALWWGPVLLVGNVCGWQSAPAQQGLFFSKAAMVTFGGAYAVLPYVGEQAVEHYHWLTTAQMMDGLGLAESTPGPLIMVLQFVGFLGGWNDPIPGWTPFATAALGAAMTTWVTFVPCFLWVLLGAPSVESLRRRPWLTNGLTGITAAVVGVIAKLAVWFGIHAIFPHGGNWMRPDWLVIGGTLLCFWLLQKKKWSATAVIALAGVAGGIWLGLASMGE